MRCTLVSAAGLIVIAGSAGSSIGWDGASGVGSRSSVRHAEGFILMETLKLVADDGAVGDGFGHSVARDGDVVIVGAPLADDTGTESGAAYVFVLPPGGGSGTVTETARLRPSDGSAGDWFGVSVASMATRCGQCVLRRRFGHGSGAAYVFERPPLDGPAPSTRSPSPDRPMESHRRRLPPAVAIDADTIVCGCLDRGRVADRRGLRLHAASGGWAGT
jgi:hypothetical protein